jgi:predicted NAD/FAD-dependent oxidoreductase
MSSPQTFDPETYDTIIIGSGVAGLAAAGVARSAGRTVCVLDKGRRIGGRVSTRRAEGFTFNHGAQFLTARQPDLITACTAAQTAGALRPWRVAGRDAFCGAPTMRDLPAFLGDGLTIRQQVEITGITRDDGLIMLHDADGNVACGRQVMVTAPAPQAARLLEPVAADLAATARSAAYAPCWTGMYGFAPEDVSGMDFSGMAEPVSARNGPVGWACWEAQRPGAIASDAGAGLVVQAAPDWSEAELEQDAASIAGALLKAWQEMTGTTLKAPVYMAAHRWRYARVIRPADATAPRQTADGMIGIAGDWTVGARVEDAFMSGHRTMTSLLALPATS